MIRTTVRLPDDLLEQAKAHARRTGRTLTQLLEQALRVEVAPHNFTAELVAERSPVYRARMDDAGGNSSTAQQPVPTEAQRERTASHHLQQVQELQDFLSALPDRDLRPADEILGYNAIGVPA